MTDLKVSTVKNSSAQLPHIDCHIGARVRERRLILGMTQRQLATLIGITYQQLHKYESGRNSLAAVRLWSLAGELGVGINYFFLGVEGSHPEKLAGGQRALLELCRHFVRIRNSQHRVAINQIVRTLSITFPESSNEQTMQS